MTNRRALDEMEYILRVRILVRWKDQGLSFHTHKDSHQNLSPLLQNILLKMRYFQKLNLATNFDHYYIPKSFILTPSGIIKQNPKPTTLFFKNQKYFAAVMKNIEENSVISKMGPQNKIGFRKKVALLFNKAKNE